jgi:hypothetical protein
MESRISRRECMGVAVGSVGVLPGAAFARPQKKAPVMVSLHELAKLMSPGVELVASNKASAEPSPTQSHLSPAKLSVHMFSENPRGFTRTEYCATMRRARRSLGQYRQAGDKAEIITSQNCITLRSLE